MSKVKVPKLTRETARSLLDRVTHVLFDCDGTLWAGDNAFQGSADLLKRLQDKQKRIFLVTNNSTQSAAGYASKCCKLGFRVSTNEILCTAECAATYLKSIKFEGKVYLIGASGLVTELENHGIEHTPIGPDPITGTRLDWLKMKPEPGVNCVLVGFDEHFCYNKMLKASVYLNNGCRINENCIFIATNEDALFPGEGSASLPGTGSIVNAVKTLAQREPVVIGKPSRIMFDLLVAREKLNGIEDLKPEQCLMIGDRLETDILFAKNCNMLSIAFMTGVASVEDMQDCPSNLAPDFYAESPAEVLQLLADI